MNSTLDHIGFHVGDFEATKHFLVASLEPLGIGVSFEGTGWAMLGRGTKGQFWFGSFGPSPGPIHIAFAADNREQVRAFHAAALANGGTDEGAPGVRLHYVPGFYAAYVRDPDGNKLACVFHRYDPATDPLAP